MARCDFQSKPLHLEQAPLGLDNRGSNSLNIPLRERQRGWDHTSKHYSRVVENPGRV